MNDHKQQSPYEIIAALAVGIALALAVLFFGSTIVYQKAVVITGAAAQAVITDAITGKSSAESRATYSSPDTPE